MMNPRLSVNQRSSTNQSLGEDLDFLERVGIEAIGLDLDRLLTATGAEAHDGQDDGVGVEGSGFADIDSIKNRLKSSGIHIADLRVSCPFDLTDPDAWPQQRERASQVMDLALALRPANVTFTSGSPGTLPWERAADSFQEAMHQILMEAHREELVISVEHNDPLLVGTGFIHTLRDAIDISWRIDSGVTMVVDSCWSERNLAGTIATGIDQIRHVRVGDRLIAGQTTAVSIVPGDGDVPIARILGQLLDAGYCGYFDVSLAGPPIEQEGYESAMERAVRHLTEILDEPDASDFDES